MDSSRDSRGIECQSRLDPGKLREGGAHVHEHTTSGVDLAKSVFELAVSDRPGAVSLRHRLTRGQFSSFLAAQPPATIVMEACASAHFWGREAQKLGHDVVLLPPHAVRPYVLRNKTDGADARARTAPLNALRGPLQLALRAALAEITELEARVRDDGCARYPASACSPRRPWSPSSAMRRASRPVATSRATSASPRASPRAVSSASSAAAIETKPESREGKHAIANSPTVRHRAAGRKTSVT
jgi:hypothetical protein